MYFLASRSAYSEGVDEGARLLYITFSRSVRNVVMEVVVLLLLISVNILSFDSGDNIRKGGKHLVGKEGQ